MVDFTVLRRMVRGRPTKERSVAQCVVAIPVRNEEGGIIRCLDALERMDRHPTALHRVLLVLNGCTDRTWETTQAWMHAHDLPTCMVDIRLPANANHAGGARAAALTEALHILAGHPRGVVLTTDADTRVPPDWLERAIDGIEAGRDVIAGDVDVDAASLTLWPAALQRRVRLEDQYALLLDEVDTLCDPVLHNPWPTHRRCSGANLVFRSSALQLLSDIPSPACGEDRALVAACMARDLRVRHDPALRVKTSARLRGRAHGGMADTLRRWTLHAEAPCDPLLEPFAAHVRRANLRACIRSLFYKGVRLEALAQAADLPFPGSVSHTCHYFGEAWQWLEQYCPSLQRRPISPVELPREIDRARAWLRMHHAQPPQPRRQEVAA